MLNTIEKSIQIHEKSNTITQGNIGCRYILHISNRNTTTLGINGIDISYAQAATKKRKYISANYIERQRIEDAIENLRNEEKKDEQVKNKLLLDQHDIGVAILKSVHEECEPSVDWVAIYTQPEPFKYGTEGPNQAAAKLALRQYKPTFMEQMVVALQNKKRQELKNAIENGIERDKALFTNFVEMHSFAARIIRGDIDAFLEILAESNPFEDLLDLGCGFDFKMEDSKRMDVVVHVQLDTTIPKHFMFLNNLGRLSSGIMSPNECLSIGREFVESVSLRVAKELFALLPLQEVSIQIIDQTLINGDSQQSTVLAINYDREQLKDKNI